MNQQDRDDLSKLRSDFESFCDNHFFHFEKKVSERLDKIDEVLDVLKEKVSTRTAILTLAGTITTLIVIILK